MGGATVVLIAQMTVKEVSVTAVERQRCGSRFLTTRTNVVNHQTTECSGGACIDARQGLARAKQVKARPVVDGVVGREHHIRTKLIVLTHAQVGLVAVAGAQHHITDNGRAIDTRQNDDAILNQRVARVGVLCGEGQRARAGFFQVKAATRLTDDAADGARLATPGGDARITLEGNVATQGAADESYCTQTARRL